MNKSKEELEKEIFGLGNAMEDYKKENRALNKKIKHTKNILFNFRQECFDKMRVVNSELFLPNQEFNTLFEKLIDKFGKAK